MNHELPVWRSLMYCPVNVEKYVDKAHTRGADVIQLDLEDSVPPSEKAGARKLGPIAAELAYGEGLQAHARAAEMRLTGMTKDAK